MKLTEKQKAFADYYIECLNATEAYQKAYDCKRTTADTRGHKLLGNARIKQYIEERMSSKESERVASQDEVLNFLTSIMRGEVKEEFPLGTGMGAQELVLKDVSAKDRLKAAELLGKRYALFTEKTELTGEVGVRIVDDIQDDVE